MQQLSVFMHATMQTSDGMLSYTCMNHRGHELAFETVVDGERVHMHRANIHSWLCATMDTCVRGMNSCSTASTREAATTPLIWPVPAQLAQRKSNHDGARWRI